MNGRRLDPEERQVWKRVAQTVTSRRRAHGKGAAKPVPKTDPTQEDFANMLRLPVQKAAPRERPTKDGLAINQDKKTRRGQVEIDQKIDLHDMTQDEARRSLHRAVMRASNRNRKCLLVVTGKGIRLDGVLRKNFPLWISEPVISPLIASYAPAHIRHGGSGAWYVFLKN